MTSARSATDREGFIQLDGWAGRSESRVLVIGETAKRYRIQAITRTKLAGRYRYIDAGQTTLVPKHAVSFTSMHDHAKGIRLNVREIFRSAT